MTCTIAQRSLLITLDGPLCAGRQDSLLKGHRRADAFGFPCEARMTTGQLAAFAHEIAISIRKAVGATFDSEFASIVSIADATRPAARPARA